MNIETLCDKIELQAEIKTQVLEFAKNFDFFAYCRRIKNLTIFIDTDISLT